MIEIIVISVIILAIICIQFYVFIATRKNIWQLSKALPSNYFNTASFEQWEKKEFEEKENTLNNDTTLVILYIEESTTDDDDKIKNPVINYLKQNNYKISNYNYIKDIIENYCDSIEHKINSIISIPLYLGLISTMSCIFISIVWGLINGLASEEWIKFLLPSISIPMIASAVGLGLTVWNTGRYYKNIKYINDKNKRDFYSFIQEYFITATPQTFDNSLEIFNNTLSDFNISFKNNIDYFNTSFQPTIEKFNKTLKEITASFSTDVKETVNKQYDIITKVTDHKLHEMANAILEIYKTLESSSANLEKFSTYVLNVNTYIENTNKLIENSNKLVGNTTNLIDSTEKTYNRFNNFGNKVEEIAKTISHNLELAGQIEEFFKNNIDYLRNQTGLVQNTHTNINNALQTYVNKANEVIKQSLSDYNNKVIDIIDQFRKSLEQRPEIFAKIEPLNLLNDNLSELIKDNKTLSDSLNNFVKAINEKKDADTNFHKTPPDNNNTEQKQIVSDTDKHIQSDSDKKTKLATEVINKTIQDRDTQEPTDYYMPLPNEEGFFDDNYKMRSMGNSDTLLLAYHFHIDKKDNNIANFYIVDSFHVREVVLKNHEQYIESVCKSENPYSNNTINISTIFPGVAEKRGDKWIVTKKALIRYIETPKPTKKEKSFSKLPDDNKIFKQQEDIWVIEKEDKRFKKLYKRIGNWLLSHF